MSAFATNYNAARNRRDNREAREQARLLQREQLAMQRDQMNLLLQEKGYTRNADGGFVPIPGGAADLAGQQRSVESQQLEMQGEALRAMKGQMSARATDDAIEDFITSGNANTFQIALNNDPFLKEMWAQRGVQTVANIDFENDADLLDDAGITLDFRNNESVKENLKKHIYKTHDGSRWRLGMVENLIAETGMLRRANSTRREMVLEHMAQLRQAMQGASPAQVQQAADTETLKAETGQQQAETDRFEAITDRQQQMLDAARAPKEMALEERKVAVDEMKARAASNPRSTMTTTQKNLAAAEDATNEMLESFGGVEEFFNTDFGDNKNFNKVYPNLVKIEKLQGVELSEADKKNLNQIRQLIGLADPAKELTSAETGLLDNRLSGLKKLISDNVDGVEARSAYAAFRNTVRHALFGSALTQPEIESFEQAFGSLKQKLGPALKQYVVSLTQVRDKLNSVTRNNNPFTMHARVGADQDKINNIISALNERIDFINGVADRDSNVFEATTESVDTLTPDTVRSMDAFLEELE